MPFIYLLASLLPVLLVLFMIGVGFHEIILRIGISIFKIII